MSGLTPAGDADRADVQAFLARAARVDDSGVLRLRRRDDGRVGLWVRTGFDVLATRTVFGDLDPADAIADLAAMQASAAAGDPVIGFGFAMQVAWQGALPGLSGFSHLDDVPAREVIALARRGTRVAREESGALGPAASLLDQTVLEVTGEDDAVGTAAISMRSVFALTAMGFVRDEQGREITEDSPLDAIGGREPIRIRVSPSWIRIDARFGSVYQRSAALGVSVL